jgi:hypothetical protein
MICHGGQSDDGYVVGGFSPKKRTCHWKFLHTTILRRSDERASKVLSER